MDIRLTKRQWILSLTIFGISLITVLLLFMRNQGLPEKKEALLFSSESTEQTFASSQSSESKEWYVDVKGAINQPGLYRIKEGMRLMDAVELAGGFTKEADQKQINFAKLLSDQEVVYVPKNGEEIPEVQLETGGQADKKAEEQIQININTADITELQQLSGIGEKKAQDIVNYREENGSFQSIDELTKVSGIGQKTLEKLRESITI
ncbi:ComE operon protein 1 [Enterococcus florum]|uniref:ComE operon protein 1 n=1 Tax=Enterococcus florum TaxID=2480627 RepID=A0A4P5P9H8_9ENTE|nr:helix-hairpin-helix domain-containing protein [Enterococcus florum]GCF94570.1 ComE operon protein 1 [Enterococcus florum]